MALQSIKRKNVSDLVFDQLQQSIIDGQWPPGTKLPAETALSEQLGVSRISIRSAIARLSSMGLLESRHGEGTFVCTFDGTQLTKGILPALVLGDYDRVSMNEFRSIIETAAAGLAAERAGEADIRKLEAIIQRMKNAKDDLEAAADEDLAFHMALAAITGNPIILQVFDMLQSIFKKSLHENVEIMGAEPGIMWHTRICEAVALHNGALARELMAAHLEGNMKTIGKENDLSNNA